MIFFRYSYDYGIVHFIMMSTEHDFRDGSRQYKWLENDLKNVDRKKTPSGLCSADTGRCIPVRNYWVMTGYDLEGRYACFSAVFLGVCFVSD